MQRRSHWDSYSRQLPQDDCVINIGSTSKKGTELPEDETNRERESILPYIAETDSCPPGKSVLRQKNLICQVYVPIHPGSRQKVAWRIGDGMFEFL